MREFFSSKYAKWGLTAVVVMVVVVTVYFFMLRASSVSNTIDLMIGILTPFFFGFLMAYLLRPIFNRVQRGIYRRARPRMKKEISAQRLSKGLAVAFSIMLLLLLLVGTLSVVLPQLAVSIYNIVVSAPEGFNDLYAWMDGLPLLTDEMKQILESSVEHFQSTAVEWARTDILPNIREIITEVSSGVIDAINVIMNFIIGIIICVYVLYSKVQFSAQAKKAVYAFCSRKVANDLIDAARFVDKVFNGYLVGKIIDSFVVGVICFAVMAMFHWPYPMLISVLVGVTNIIPFFGPFIGGIPSAILILTVDPMACVYFVIFIVILQQVEGNIIAPKILGDSTGLPSFWVMFSILIGGGLFGFMGMIIGVPIFAVIYAFIGEWVGRRLKRRCLPADTASYEHLYHVDPESDAFIFLEGKEGNQGNDREAKEKK